jgi:hypothetical protein
MISVWLSIGIVNIIPILQNEATDNIIRLDEMKDKQCQGYIN